MITAGFYKALTQSDSDDNGGLMSVSSISESRNAFLPSIRKSEVMTGVSRLRKCFITPEYQLPYCRVYLDAPTTAYDTALMHAGTESDIQSDTEGYSEWKGSGMLTTGLSAGNITTINVESENEGIGFNPLDLVRLSNGTNEEFIRIQSISWNGCNAEITVMPDTVLNYDYSAGGYVSACIEKGVAGIIPVWLKEIVPIDCAFKRNNEMRLKVVV